MSDKTQGHLSWGACELALSLLLGTGGVGLFIEVASSNDTPYGMYLLGSVFAFAITFFGAVLFMLFVKNCVLFINQDRVIQEIDDDPEIDEAYDQLVEAGVELGEKDDIIRDDEDGELYLCLGDEVATGIDLKLVKNDEGRWETFISSEEEDIPAPLSYVASLRARSRQWDSDIIDEIKRLQPATA